MRAFIAPPDASRCHVQRQPLSDKSTARCMKYIDQPHCIVCKQHRKMFRDGKTLISHVTGQKIESIIEYQK